MRWTSTPRVSTASMTSNEIPSSTTNGMPGVAPTATRNTAFSTVSRARICVMAFFRVTIRNNPINSVDRATPIKWWPTPLVPSGNPVLAR